MSDIAWLAVVVILLGFVAVVIVILLRNGEGENGLKGEFGQRLTDLENDVDKIWTELRRQNNRWVP